MLPVMIWLYAIRSIGNRNLPILSASRLSIFLLKLVSTLWTAATLQHRLALTRNKMTYPYCNRRRWNQASLAPHHEAASAKQRNNCVAVQHSVTRKPDSGYERQEKRNWQQIESILSILGKVCDFSALYF
jgi:hypothetical protein